MVTNAAIHPTDKQTWTFFYQLQETQAIINQSKARAELRERQRQQIPGPPLIPLATRVFGPAKLVSATSHPNLPETHNTGEYSNLPHLYCTSYGPKPTTVSN